MKSETDAIKKEIKHIAIGTLIGSAITCIVFLIIRRFDYTVLLGALIGSAFAIGNFAYLGHCIKKAVDMADRGKSYLTKTFIVRMLLHAACIILAVLMPFENTIAGIVPLFFPRLVIYAMQLLGIYKPEKK